MTDQPRKGLIDDADRCAEIVNNWIKTTKGVPRFILNMNF
ncbi:MAG: hypothetical protein CM1200mP16_14800 [Nitrospina sp.]|nr:MAG: hypothetical protein CM1200mP16_14800 [Nitrospina sp.]